MACSCGEAAVLLSNGRTRLAEPVFATATPSDDATRQ